MESSSSSSSDSSFVLVGDATTTTTVDSSLLVSLQPYFPHIASPTTAFHWDYSRTQQVHGSRQARPDGRLFIDELLSLVQLDGPTNYPPPSAAAFNSLLFSLLTSPSTLQAHCIIFYLLLADSSTSSSTSPLPTAFARNFLLPTGFVRGVEGFHALDAADWRAAVAALTDPHLTPDFVDKTFGVLSACPEVQERAGLVLSFWRLSGVGLSSKKEASIVLQALCDQERRFGVVEAWGMQRKWAVEEERAELATRVLASCFGDNGRAKPVAHHLQALLSHPFTPTEDALVTSFCLSPSSSSIPKTLTADWRLSKFIAEGRPIDALRFWAQAKSSVKPNDERERLLKAVHATLTEVQRNELALEADDYTPAVASTSRTPTAATTSNITQPAWQPLPLPAPTPLPRNLIATPRTTAPPTSRPTPADLPLSASPFLRREKPLVSSVDGSAMGGVQKSVLRALREGAAGNTSPFKSGGGLSDSPEKASAGSPFRSAAVARESLFGSPRVGTPVAPQSQPQVQYPAYSLPQPAPSSARKPTLAGFGSVRLPSASAAHGKARDESLSLFAAAGGKERWDEQAGAEDEAMGMDVEEEEHVGGDARDVHQDDEREEVEDQTFGFRAAQDPSIAATIAAAAAPTSATASSSKRRNRSSMDTSTDKRRAVSTEPEDRRPSASVKVGKTPAKGGRRSSKASATPTTASKSKVLPGGWDDGDSDAGHDHDDTEPEQQEVLVKATRTRRSARASSAQPATPQAKPKAKATRAEPAVATPRPTRRSSRLQTPAKEDAEDAAPRSVRKATGGTARKAGSGRRKAIEEEEEEE